METTLAGDRVRVGRLSDDALLDLVEQSETQCREADRRKLRYALVWATRHRVDRPDDAARWSDADARDVEQTLGGEGTPLVASSCVEPFAVALGISSGAAMQLMSDALDLFYRHRRLWRRVESLQVAPWRARRIAKAAHHLSEPAAAHVDERLAPVADHCGVVKIDRLVTEAAQLFEPASQALAEDEARAAWGVTVTTYGGAWAGTSRLEVVGDTPTLTRFHDLLRATAHEALDPALPVDQQPSLAHRRVAALATVCDLNGAGSVTTLHYHLDAAALAALPDPVVRTGSVERLGRLTVEAIASLLGTSRFTVRPVLDLRRADAVDQHDPPAWMRELVVQRDRECVFPWCHRDARDCDLDHIEAYVDMDDGGPPGQTAPDKLAALCRRHHRAKTHFGWTYRRDADGGYTWTSPHGRVSRKAAPTP